MTNRHKVLKFGEVSVNEAGIECVIKKRCMQCKTLTCKSIHGNCK